MQIRLLLSGFSAVTKALAIVVLASVAATAVASAGSSSAQMAVSVTVVRSCSVDARAENSAPVVRLTCTTGAQSTLRVSATEQPPSAAVVPEAGTVLTLNF
jgi:hypothetical protein